MYNQIADLHKFNISWKTVMEILPDFNPLAAEFI